MTVFVCKKCGHTQKAGEKDLVKRSKREQVEERNMRVVESSEEALPIVDAECPKCGHDKAYFWTLQTRSADEAETRFFRCVQCKYTWREYD